MNRYVTEELYRIPDLHPRLDRAARRERARVLAAAFQWLRDRLTPRFHGRPSQWLARLG